MSNSSFVVRVQVAHSHPVALALAVPALRSPVPALALHSHLPALRSQAHLPSRLAHLSHQAALHSVPLRVKVRFYKANSSGLMKM